MAEYIEYHPLKFWLDPASIAEIVAHIQDYLVDNPINSTTEIETIIHDYIIAHPELVGGVDSVNGETGEVVLTADNISAGENVTIADVLDSLQDQIDDIVASIPSDYQQLIDDVSDLKSAFSETDNLFWFSDTSERELSGLTLTFIDKSTIQVNGTASANVTLFSRGGTKAGDLTIPAGSYIYHIGLVSGTGTLPKLRFGATLQSLNPDTALTFESDTSASLRIANGTTYDNAVFQIMLNEGTTIKRYIVGGLTPEDIVARNEIEPISESINQILTGADFQELDVGTISSASGLPSSSESVMRTIGYVGNYIKNITTKNNYVFYVLAYESGEYVGAWNKSLGTFQKSFSNWYQYLDFSVIPNSDQYLFKIVVKHDPEAQIDVDAAKDSVIFSVNQIGLLTNAVTDLKDEEFINRYNADDIVPLKSAAKLHTASGYVKPLVLLHFSDSHNSGNDLPFIRSFYKNNSANIDDLLCTGDIVGSYYSAAHVTNWFNYFTNPYCLLVLGNHDYYTDSAYETYLTQAQAFADYMQPTIAEWGAVYTSGKTYWYKDYAESNVRVIGIDNMLSGDDMTAQVTWIAGVLTDANTKGYAVVIAGHCPPNQTGEKIESSFTSIPPLPASYSDIALDGNSIGIMSAVNDFMQAGGEFVCYLMGHWHTDYLLYASEYPDQAIVVVGTASSDPGPNGILTSPIERDNGTKFQYLFNLVAVDKSNGVFKLLRIGADRDAYMRSRVALCFDYKNHRVVFSD